MNFPVVIVGIVWLAIVSYLFATLGGGDDDEPTGGADAS